ncbi:MAG: hypothetical protein IKQ31_03070 [Clostridia bacterium]|nr:hypothetical protein [Clostridia bacterium]MBR4314012.1 hypothetical protein [Lachnospiraceae bacterium]
MTKYEINEQIAKSAKELNSFDDYKANSATNEYNSYLNDFEQNVNELMAKHPENLNEEALQLIEYYKDKYSKKLAFAINKSNSIEAMMPSIMISGGGNFNFRKKEKQNRARENFWNEYGNLFNEDNYYYNKIRNIILNKVIYSDDAMVIEKLEAKIDNLKELQSKMKEVNAYYKKNKTLKGCELLTEDEAIKIMNNIQYHSWYPVPFAPFELTNNNQNIHRLEDRLESLKKLKQRASEENENKYIQVDGLQVVEDATDMRIRLIFNEIPNEKVRELIKHWGFKWSPKNSAWQRQLTRNGIYATNKVLEQLKEMN